MVASSSLKRFLIFGVGQVVGTETLSIVTKPAHVESQMAWMLSLPLVGGLTADSIYRYI